MIKIAHCTDFSENAKKALNGMLFNFWSFDIAVDIIHLAEDDFEESLVKLELLKKELIAVHGSRFVFQMYIFKKDQRDFLIEQLNSYNYFGLLVGLNGAEKRAGIGSFLQGLYDAFLGNLIIVPLIHEIKIENRVLVAVAYENVQSLRALEMISEFMNFNFAKLTVLIKAKVSLDETEKKAINDILASSLQAASYDLVIQNTVNSARSLAHFIAKRNIDYCIVFKDDFYDKKIYELFKAKPLESNFSQRVARVSSPKEKVNEDFETGGRLTLRKE